MLKANLKRILVLGLSVLGITQASAAPNQAVPNQAVPAEHLAAPGVIPATAQRSGDAAAGYQALVSQAYVSCGVPWSAFSAMGAATADYALPQPADRPANLPYAFNRFTNADGIDIVASNCLTCHAAPFTGELVLGLGNEHLDFSDDPVINAELAGAFIEDEIAARPWQRWADRIAAIAPFLRTDTRGVNPAPNLTLALIAHRDPQTLAWSAQPALPLPPTQPLPVSVPPWWRMAKKHAMFYNGMGRGDQTRFMMMKALVCTDNIAEAQAIYDYFDDIRAFIISLRPPRYPFPIDRTLAAQGQTVFEQTCAACHGTYGESWQYPNLLVGLEQVGTDPAYARQIVAIGGPYIDWFQQSFYGQGAQVKPALGYIAPPLDGVWATAPYLHNGSIPTLAALLDSPQRPRYWTRDFERPVFDQQTLGWRFSVLDQGKAGVTGNARSRIYDTTLPGFSNAGHTFGDALEDTQRRALLEYLKTL